MSDPVTAPEMVSVIAAALEAHCTVNYVLDGDGENNNFILCDQCGHEEMNPSAAEDEWMTAHQAAAVLAAISEAGTVEWGVAGRNGYVNEYETEADARLQVATRDGYTLWSRPTFDWERAE